MDPKILTEDGWKAIVQKFKLKDKDLQKSLFFYENLEDDDFDFRLKGIVKISTLGTALRKDKEVAANPAVVKYLADLVSSAQVAQREIIKDKAEAEKAKALAAKTQALTQKKAEADTKQRDLEEKEAEAPEEEEEEEGDYADKLKKALTNLKSAKAPYNFMVCDAKPQCGLVVSKQLIGAKHKEELTKVTGGSKRFLKVGKCRRDGTTLIFEMDNPPQGLAGKLLKAIKFFTGIKYKVMVGNESAEDDEGEPALTGVNPELRSTENPPQPAAAARPGQPSSKPAEEQAAGAAATATPTKGPLSLGGSVGRGGKNKPEDVTAVQTALNTRAKAGLSVNGKCDPKTIKAIEDFQKALGKFKPDGLIEPGRGTARALAGTGKLPPPPEPPKPIAPPKLGKPTLEKAPVVWHGTRGILDTNIKELKKGIRQEYADEHPDLLAEIDKRMTRLDVVLEKLDHRLADSLANAYAAKDPAARKTEMANAKAILTDYIKYVKTEPMIAHMDSNPFGVKTNLQKVLTDSLTHVAKVIH